MFKVLKEQQTLEEAEVVNIVLQITKALNYLHSKSPPIIHRDLKPENVLFNDGVVKLIDFGWSNYNDDFRNTFCGTTEYLCPEMIQGTGHSEKLDIWTLGILTFELLNGYTPFSPKNKGLDQRNLQLKVQENILNGKVVFPPEMSPESVNFIKSILVLQPQKRPSAEKLLESEFLN